MDIPSQILTESMNDDLFQMLQPIFGNDPLRLQKLHDKNDCGSASRYDIAVRPHANVLTVIQSDKGQVFGGFFVQAMGIGTTGWHNGHPRDFIFSLGSAAPKEEVCTSVKLLKPAGYSNRRAINRGCGLHMGNNDLNAFCGNMTAVPTVYTVPAFGYPSLPVGESIAGRPEGFNPVKMEVYRVDVNPKKRKRDD